LYIVQLKEDVKTAMSVVDSRIESADKRGQQAYVVLSFLDTDTDDSIEPSEFEDALDGLGRFATPEIGHGHLGQLLDGNLDSITRDKELAKNVLSMTEKVKYNLAIVLENGEFFKLAQATFSKYLGRKNFSFPDMKISYDLDSIRSANEFHYASQNLLQFLADAKRRYSDIKDELEAFLTYLEERY